MTHPNASNHENEKIAFEFLDRILICEPHHTSIKELTEILDAKDAALRKVVAEEREACAKVAMKHLEICKSSGLGCSEEITKAIRERVQK